MKNNTAFENILDQLTSVTHSPRGKYAAEESYTILNRRISARNKRLRLIRFASAAAAVVLFSVLSWSIYNHVVTDRIITIHTLAQTKDILLPDGTEVTLNRYTTFSYPRSFNGDNREVALSGEAFFNVVKDEQHPFIVNTGNMDVQVLGTCFNIDAYERNTEIRTTLFKGSVAVSGKEKPTRMILVPNEMAIFDKETGAIKKTTLINTENKLAWREGKFIFDKVPLGEIIRELSNAFDVQIHITDPSLESYRMIGSFVNNENLEEILQLLSAVGNFNYTRDEHTIHITK